MNFYFQAADTLDRIDAKRGSVKSLLSTILEKDRKRTAALVIETLKYKPVLTEIIETSKLLQEERKLKISHSLALVLVHDVLFAKSIQASDGPIKQAVLRHKTRLHSELQKIKIKRGVKAHSDLAQTGDERAELIPRYVRVNTLVWTTSDAVGYFVSRGFTLSATPFESIRCFSRDEHIPDLLLFPPKVQFMDDPMYKSGHIILQDKASCFPAIVLAPPAHRDAVVIDATAAPGNKTSHLSALMRNEGKVIAFERDRKRFATLTMMLSKAHCRNVEPLNADFLKADPLDARFAAVTHILLDPSCSGSGIVNRLDHLMDENEVLDSARERLQKLSSFQLSMIRHAMTFPAVRRIVYSTCSVNTIENEQVVLGALDTQEAQVGGFLIAPRSEVLPAWPRRGLAEEMRDPDYAFSLLRCCPGEDATNGFFVSCFVRGIEGAGKTHLTSTDSTKRRRGGGDDELGVSSSALRARKKTKTKKAPRAISSPT